MGSYGPASLPFWHHEVIWSHMVLPVSLFGTTGSYGVIWDPFGHYFDIILRYLHFSSAGPSIFQKVWPKPAPEYYEGFPMLLMEKTRDALLKNCNKHIFKIMCNFIENV